MEVGQSSITEGPTAIIGGRFYESVRITNIGHARVWIGSADVNTSSGYPLEPGATETFSGAAGLYGVRYPAAFAGGTPPLAVVAWAAE